MYSTIEQQTACVLHIAISISSLVLPNWQRHRARCRRSPFRTLPYSRMRLHVGGDRLWCDLRRCSQTVVVIEATAKTRLYQYLTAIDTPHCNRARCSDIRPCSRCCKQGLASTCGPNRTSAPSFQANFQARLPSTILPMHRGRVRASVCSEGVAS